MAQHVGFIVSSCSVETASASESVLWARVLLVGQAEWCSEHRASRHDPFPRNETIVLHRLQAFNGPDGDRSETALFRPTSEQYEPNVSRHSQATERL